jgi:hypothetical protein
MAASIRLPDQPYQPTPRQGMAHRAAQEAGNTPAKDAEPSKNSQKRLTFQRVPVDAAEGV